MKRIINFSSIFIALLIVFLSSSCEKNMGDPSLSFLEADGFVSNDTMLMVGDTITVGVIIESNGTNNLQSLEVLVSDLLLNTYTLDQARGEYSFKIMKSTSQEEIWEFVLADSKGNRVSKQLSLTKDPNSIYGGILSYNIKLGAQSNPNIPGFLAFNGPVLYDINSAFLHQSEIDLVYYFDETDKHVLASPGANIPEGIFSGGNTIDTWTTIRTTNYILSDYTEEDFEGFFHDGFILQNYTPDMTKRKAKNLTVGDVYILQNEDGLMGAFCVKSVEGTFDGEIEISLILQDK